jgi:hypothetical protein
MNVLLVPPLLGSRLLGGISFSVERGI